ncbi:MAG: SDR family oxidoreductase [Acidobacteriota bacterium]|nr:SDR family oxidoreductase [Acidobacteriota bacterium]
MDFAELNAAARDVGRTRLDPSDILLTGQVAVVTGGGGGIGQGVALGLARFGAKVAVLDIFPERCEATEEAIRNLGQDGLGLVCDVIDSDGLRSSLSTVVERFGRIDILVNNAGGVRAGSFVTQPETSIRRHIDINLVSTLIATQEAARHMIAGGRGGSIVNVASIEASRAAPLYAVYAACKAGMANFTRTMALELAEHGIRVNCIAPDHTITPGMRGNRAGPVDPASWEDSDEGWAATIPLGREGLVDECAGAVVWLCSKMAAYVTGINLPVDGGTWASSGWLREEGGWGLKP